MKPFEQRQVIDASLGLMLGKMAEGDPVAVLILAEEAHDLPNIEKAAGDMKVKFRYSVVPAIAATLTKSQIERLAKTPGVSRIEHDAQVHILQGSTDYFGATKARADFGVSGNRDGQPTYSKNDIVVAVIDTGIDATHVDLTGKVIAWHDLVNGRATPYDDHGHGSHCAGIVAGAGRGDSRYTGVAPGAALVGIKVLDSFGSGALSDVAAAVDWVVQNQAEYHIRVISMSLGTGNPSDGTDIVCLAVNRAAEAGIAVAVAAGNSGPITGTIGSPGAAEGAITVAAMADPTQGGFGLATFSSRGPTVDNRVKPDIAAPGVNIYSCEAGSTDQYIAFSGTSMATPFVAGTLALMLDASPALTVPQLRRLLQETAADWGPAGQDVDYGWGRLDVYAAVRAAGNFTGGSPPAVPGHRYFEGALSSTGQQSRHTVDIDDTTVPVCVTLVMPDWNGSSNPDFELYLYNPDGSEASRSTSTSRQEQVILAPGSAGTYTIQVKSYAGSGKYFVDVSGGIAAPDQPPAVAVALPVEGAVVSGRLAVKVQATDDHNVSKVELGVDGGAFTDITGSFDGAYYTFVWDTESLSNGWHILTAGATDDAGQIARVDRTVDVENRPPPAPPQFRVTRTGTVRGTARDSLQTISVLGTGYADLRLSWNTAADLDFFVYGPDGVAIGRAYTLNNPELLRLDTVKWGTGTYSVRVNLFGGPDTPFTLTGDGYRKSNFTGSVSPAAPDFVQRIGVGYAGRGLAVLSWQGAADLDIYVYDPSGRLRAQGFTVNNPEQVAVQMDVTGTWSVRVNLFAGAATNFTLAIWAPDTVLS